MPRVSQQHWAVILALLSRQGSARRERFGRASTKCYPVIAAVTAQACASSPFLEGAAPGGREGGERIREKGATIFGAHFSSQSCVSAGHHWLDGLTRGLTNLGQSLVVVYAVVILLLTGVDRKGRSLSGPAFDIAPGSQSDAREPEALTCLVHPRPGSCWGLEPKHTRTRPRCGTSVACCGLLRSQD